MEREIQIPDDYLCPITREIMHHPVMAADGYSYEEIAIKDWFKRGYGKSPMTNLKLTNLELHPNIFLKNKIKELKEILGISEIEECKIQSCQEILMKPNCIYNINQLTLSANAKEILINFLNNNINEKPVDELKKIYTATLDGDRNFHNFCDNKGPTVVIISANGRLFGGYTSKNWEKSGKYISDKKAFLFSLTNNKKYPINPDTAYWGIYSPSDEITFYFGFPNDLCIYEGFLSKNINISKLSCYRNPDRSEAIDSLANTDCTFVVSEMEVFQVVRTGIDMNLNNNLTLASNTQEIIINFLNNNINERPVEQLIKIYKATIDGDTNFHNFCDNKGPTVVIISANGHLFGGYTTENWDRSGKYKNDEKAFLFSLTNNKKYPINPDTAYWAIYNPSETIVLSFGYPEDLTIYEGFLSSDLNVSSLSCYRNLDGSEAIVSLANIDDSFVIDEMEVFQVIRTE